MKRLRNGRIRLAIHVGPKIPPGSEYAFVVSNNAGRPGGSRVKSPFIRGTEIGTNSNPSRARLEREIPCPRTRKEWINGAGGMDVSSAGGLPASKIIPRARQNKRQGTSTQTIYIIVEQIRIHISLD